MVVPPGPSKGTVGKEVSVVFCRNKLKYWPRVGSKNPLGIAWSTNHFVNQPAQELGSPEDSDSGSRNCSIANRNCLRARFNRLRTVPMDSSKISAISS